MRRAFSGTVIGVLLVGFLASCTGGGKEPPGLTASPSATPESPSASPTPVDAPIDRSDPDLGIVFTDLPDVTGDARSALDTLTLFEVEAWRAQKGGVMNDVISLIASSEMVALLQAQLDGNAEGGWTLSGELDVAITVEQADAQSALATVCQDWSKVISTQDGVAHTAEDLGEQGGYLFEVPMSRASADGPWSVVYYERTGTC